MGSVSPNIVAFAKILPVCTTSCRFFAGGHLVPLPYLEGASYSVSLPDRLGASLKP